MGDRFSQLYTVDDMLASHSFIQSILTHSFNQSVSLEHPCGPVLWAAEEIASSHLAPLEGGVLGSRIFQVPPYWLVLATVLFAIGTIMSIRMVKQLP